MLITQTPLRVSIAGGGTDFRDFYTREGGAVLSMAIDKYVYVIVKERFDDKIYINYSKKEIVNSVDEIQHDLVREAMRKTGVSKGVEVTTLADVPSEGTGLGSSSSITVGLLNAFYACNGEQVTAERLAREACEIEIDIIGKPIGLQDHYIAAYGDLRFIEFLKDSTVRVNRLDISESQKRRLVSNLLLFYTNTTRNSEDILHEQKRNIENRLEELRKIRDMAYEARFHIVENNSIDQIGHLLRRSWEEKKKLSSNISTPEIDRVYERAISAGALGGKLAGAGGGGFFLFYCPLEKQDKLRQALSDLRELPFSLERDGVKTIFNIRRWT